MRARFVPQAVPQDQHVVDDSVVGGVAIGNA
jgi:hypothetical protein